MESLAIDRLEARQPGPGAMGDESRIWVGGLPDKITEEEIKEEYLRYGDVKHVKVRHNPGQCSFAFVQYSNRDEAKSAMKDTDQARLFGMPFVKVAWAGVNPRRNKGEGKGGRSKSDGRRSRSPRRRSPPRRRSSSRRRSPSPRRRSPTPHRRSPAPRRRSRSLSAGQRRSPTPRRRSGSRRRSPLRGRSVSRRRSPSRRRDSPRKERSPIRRGKVFTVVVENLPSDMTSRELQDIAGDFALCTGARVEHRGKKGRAEIDFTSEDDMVRVVKEFDKRRLGDCSERLKAYAKEVF